MSAWTDITWQQLNARLNGHHHVTAAKCLSELTSRDSSWMSVLTDITWKQLNVRLNWHHVTAAECPSELTSRDSSWMSVWTDITWQQLNVRLNGHHVTAAERTDINSDIQTRYNLQTHHHFRYNLTPVLTLQLFLASSFLHRPYCLPEGRMVLTGARTQWNTHLCFVSSTVLKARTCCLTSVLITSVKFRSLRWVLLHP